MVAAVRSVCLDRRAETLLGNSTWRRFVVGELARHDDGLGLLLLEFHWSRKSVFFSCSCSWWTGRGARVPWFVPGLRPTGRDGLTTLQVVCAGLALVDSFSLEPLALM